MESINMGISLSDAQSTQVSVYDTILNHDS